MKDWFPFTDYDFYAYLVSGGAVLVAADYLFNAGGLLFSTSLSILQGVLLIALSYIVGSIIAGFSATIVEHGLLRRIFIPPSEIQLGLREARIGERILAILAAQFELKPLPTNVREELLSKTDGSQSPTDRAESIFFSCHSKAMAQEVSQKRLGSFMNQYGLYRNMTLTFVIVFFMALIATKADRREMVLWVSLIAAVLTFLRFVKYYAAFSKEVFRGGR